MKVPFSPPDITEKEIQYVTDVLRSGWITTGQTVKDFEKKICEFIGTNRCVALASATAAPGSIPGTTAAIISAR